MQLRVVRTTFTPDATIGELYVDGRFQCYTLEDVVRPADAPKVYGRTAIPEGTYRVQLTLSPRFKKVLPLLENVPNFAGVRIHSGNTSADTEGCILVGTSKQKDFVGNSRVAFNRLMTLLEGAKDEIFITIGSKVSSK